MSLLLVPVPAVTWDIGRDFLSCSQGSGRLTLPLPWVSRAHCALTAPAQLHLSLPGWGSKLKTGQNYVTMMWIPPEKTMAKYMINIDMYVCSLKLSSHSIYVYVIVKDWIVFWNRKYLFVFQTKSYCSYFLSEITNAKQELSVHQEYTMLRYTIYTEIE